MYLQDVTSGVQEPFNDSNLYFFLKSISEQNKQILARLDGLSAGLEETKSRVDNTESLLTGLEQRLGDEIDLAVRKVKGVGSHMTNSQIS